MSKNVISSPTPSGMSYPLLQIFVPSTATNMYHLRPSQGVGAGLGADSSFFTFSSVGQGVVTTSVEASPMGVPVGASVGAPDDDQDAGASVLYDRLTTERKMIAARQKRTVRTRMEEHASAGVFGGTHLVCHTGLLLQNFLTGGVQGEGQDMGLSVGGGDSHESSFGGDHGDGKSLAVSGGDTT